MPFARQILFEKQEGNQIKKNYLEEFFFLISILVFVIY